MKFYLVAFSAAAVFLLWTSWYSSNAALASSGFIGTWCGSSSSIHAYTITDFPRLEVKSGPFTESSAHYSGSQLVAERWAQTGTLSSDGNKIIWSDGKTWVRTAKGARGCGIFAAAATPPPPQVRYLKGFVSGRGPIEFIGSWTAVTNDGTRAYTCFTFKNTGSVAATQFNYLITLTSPGNHVVDSTRRDRKGTFSPNVEIHGWHSFAEMYSRQGNRDYNDNCIWWKPEDEAQRQGYPRLEEYSVQVARVDFADGTIWPVPPTPEQYRDLKWGSAAGSRPPIEIVSSFTALKHDGANGYTCISFRNTSGTPATRILFDVILSNQGGHVVDTGSLDRKGTFPPNDEIYGWHSLVEYVNHWNSIGGYSSNCVKWTPDDEAQRLAYPTVEYYSIGIKLIEFADGTMWPSASKNPSPLRVR